MSDEVVTNKVEINYNDPLVQKELAKLYKKGTPHESYKRVVEGRGYKFIPVDEYEKNKETHDTKLAKREKVSEPKSEPKVSDTKSVPKTSKPKSEPNYITREEFEKEKAKRLKLKAKLKKVKKDIYFEEISREKIAQGEEEIPQEEIPEPIPVQQPVPQNALRRSTHMNNLTNPSDSVVLNRNSLGLNRTNIQTRTFR